MNSTRRPAKWGQMFASWGFSILVLLLIWRILTYFVWTIVENNFEIPDDVWVDAVNGSLLVLLFIYAFIVWKDDVPTLHRGELRLGKKKLGIWLEAGDYWFPFLNWNFFNIYKEELQDEQKRDVVMEPFELTDKKGKLLIGDLNGDWEVDEGDSAAEKFERFREEDMKGNLQALLRKTSIRVFGAMDYFNDILGKELNQSILNDTAFLAECSKYGIKFKNVIVSIISANRQQDDINNYVNQLTTQLKQAHPEMKAWEINELVNVRLKLVKAYVFKGRGANPIVRVDE